MSGAGQPHALSGDGGGHRVGPANGAFQDVLRPQIDQLDLANVFNRFFTDK